MTSFKMRTRTRVSMLSGVGLGAMAVAMLGGPASAQGQASAPASSAGANAGGSPQAVQEIVVTGVRASVASAIQLKKTADQLQDSIVAEDIGKLPDNNVVEALQHVTGISIIRNNVEPNTVLVRGLPDIATTLNGREIFTSAGRFLSLPDLPAELLAKVDVKKSSTADDLEGGIAGLINVDLHRPFDFRTPQFAGGVKGTYGTLSNKYSPTISVLASDRWMTGAGEVGALIDVSYQKRLTSTDTINQITQLVLRRAPNPPITATGPAGTFPGSATVTPGQIATPSTTTFGEAPTSIERTAFNGSLQWRPNDRLEFFAEAFYSKLRNEAPNQVNVFLLGVNPNADASVPFTGTNVGQILPSGGYGLTSTQDRHSIEDTYQIATGGKWQVNDKLKVDGEFDYTNSKSNTTAYIVDAQYNYTSTPSVTKNLNGVTLSYNTLGNGGVIAVQPNQQQLNPANTFLDQFYDTANPVSSGHEYALRFSGNYEVGNSFIRSIDAGYRYDDRSAISDGTAFQGLNCALTSGDGSNVANKYRLAALNSPACTAFRANSGPVAGGQATNYVGGVSYASLGQGAYSAVQHDFFGGMFGTSRWVSLAPGFIRNNISQMRTLFGYSGPQDYVPTNHFDVDERSHAGFVKVNYAFDAGNIPIDGNIGVRIIQTTLTEKGFTSRYVPLDPTVGSTQGVNATCITCVVYTPTTATKTDTQVLPSFNVRAKLIDNLYLRAGFSDTVTRPTFAQLNPGLTISAPTATLLGTATGGNPDLVPVKSRNYDLDLSYYWGKANHVTVATFYRQVSGYIQTAQTNLVISGQNYIYSRPANFQNDDIKGIEVGYSQFLDFLPGLWSGLGWDVNATEIAAHFNNVAPYHVNASGIYEQGPYSLRFSYTWNAEYKVGAFSTGAQPQFTYAAPRDNADISFNYRWNDHVTFTVDATNLLDGYQRQYAGKGSQNRDIFPTGLQRFDKTYSIGLRAKW